jgi:AbrB family looped-hinge helix DNA binding protein
VHHIRSPWQGVLYRVIFLLLRILLERRTPVRVTSKGQVTIPQRIREKLGIAPNSEVDFVEDGDRVYLLKKSGNRLEKRFRALRGIATVKMTTDEILAMTRGTE